MPDIVHLFYEMSTSARRATCYHRALESQVRRERWPTMAAAVVKVASVQATPVFLDRAATLEKACSLILEAGRNGAQLVVLPEAFIPCFPVWIAVTPSATGPDPREHAQLYADLLASSVDVPGPVTTALGEAAREAAAHVVVGVNERNAEAS